MDDFDFDSMSSSSESSSRKGSSQHRHSSGSHSSGNRRWFFELTFLAIILVGGLSYLMCHWTADVINRPFWMIGLIFMVPAGAMFFAAMWLEFATGKMTPGYNRKPQVIIATVATLLTFLVGCLFDGIYLLGGFFQDTSANYVFVVDRGDTMDWDAYGDGTKTRREVINDTYQVLLGGMYKNTVVGGVAADWNVLETVPAVRVQKEGQALAMANLTSATGAEGISFVNSLNAALDIADGITNNRPTLIVVLTGGQEAVYEINDSGDVTAIIDDTASDANMVLRSRAASDAVINRALSCNCIIYGISVNGDFDESLRNVADRTGGKCFSAAEAVNSSTFLSEMVVVDSDMIRADSTPSIVLTTLMLLFEGIVIGLGLMLMLSLRGQFRAQVIISPIMALTAAFILKWLNLGHVNAAVESFSLALLGIVFMMDNTGVARKAGNARNIVDTDDPFGDFSSGADSFGSGAGSSSSSDSMGDDW